MKNLWYLSLFFVLISCKYFNDDFKVITGKAIGTTYTIKYIDSEDQNVELLIYSLINDLNNSISTYMPTTDISKINKGDSTIVIDAYFEEVFEKSKRIHKETDGYFDPTVGILVNFWGFGPDNNIKKYDAKKFQELRKFVGLDNVKLEFGKIKKTYPEIYLDFNAIAKGYLVDIIGRQFEQNNIDNYLIEIGGEIRARGVNQDGEFWRVAIENPNMDGSRSFAETIQLKDQSIATSGNYRKFRINERGTKYVHTVNAKTGYAFQSSLLSASVISTFDCADVDAYATAFMSMGYTKSMYFLTKHQELKAFLIYADEFGKLKVYKTPNFYK